MNPQRQVRLGRNADGQVVYIPAEFELPGNEAVIRREGDRLILAAGPPAPAHPANARLLFLLATLAPLGAEDEMPDVKDGPPGAVDL